MRRSYVWRNLHIRAVCGIDSLCVSDAADGVLQRIRTSTMGATLAYFCAALMDRLDDVFVNSRTGPWDRPVVALNKAAGLVSTDDILLKNRTINALRECFIDTQAFAIRKAHLALFVSNEGFELLTTYEGERRLCFLIRADSYDVVVEYTK